MFTNLIFLFLIFGGCFGFLFPDQIDLNRDADVDYRGNIVKRNHLDGDDADEDPCIGKDYCEFPNDYPEREILAKVEYEFKKNKLLRLMLKKPKSAISPQSPEVEIGLRFAYDEPENVCSMITENIRPRKHKNTQGQDRFIVNAPMGKSEYTQEITVGVCRGNNADLKTKAELMVDSAGTQDECGQGSMFEAKTECFQEYLAHKMVAVDLDNNEIVLDQFHFPSCCVCKLISLDF